MVRISKRVKKQKIRKERVLRVISKTCKIEYMHF
jgi:hypothetical protein